MSKGWGRAAVAAGITLMVANQASPGTSTKVLTNAKDTTSAGVDAVAETTNDHLIPAAGDTLTAAKDGLAQTNLLGPSQPPAWAPDPQAGG